MHLEFGGLFTATVMLFIAPGIFSEMRTGGFVDIEYDIAVYIIDINFTSSCLVVQCNII